MDGNILNEILESFVKFSDEQSEDVGQLNDVSIELVEDIIPSQEEQIQTANDTLDMILTEILPELIGE